jgi:hypothetical protein
MFGSLSEGIWGFLYEVDSESSLIDRGVRTIVAPLQQVRAMFVVDNKCITIRYQSSILGYVNNAALVTAERVRDVSGAH